MYQAVIDAPFGRVGIRTRCDAGDAPEILAQLVYLPPATALRAPETALAQCVAQQIEGYLTQPSADFDVPRATVGTPFQQRVWQAISEIPCGTVRTYGQLARALGSAPRAVGQACGANYFPLLIPCHRVVGANGIGGFSQYAADHYFLSVKRWLLAHEGITYP
jgi:methylated-DNA-[protein]-cysteine S-methyltransferase